MASSFEKLLRGSVEERIKECLDGAEHDSLSTCSSERNLEPEQDEEASRETRLRQELAKNCPCQQARNPHSCRKLTDIGAKEQEALEAESATRKAELIEKQALRDAYGIGWNFADIPRNDVTASRLVLRDVPQGMVCIVSDEASQSFGVAATLEPAAAINLEYLSIALQVRRMEGHEPMFSLDRIVGACDTMQEKRFTPEWLAGTSIGEVLFQADYYLKELSMGQHEQPVLGMQSCIDYSETTQEYDWSGREWFLVRKAEVQISESNVLVPRVQMGVEAREQFQTAAGMKDKQITRRNHPMVKYAEAFTHNFDLIAERRSVIFNLREVAKASVLAKHMLASCHHLGELWFDLAEERNAACSLEVPQLWSERFSLDESVQKSERRSDLVFMQKHCVYGGVDFGLEKFNLGATLQTAVHAAVPQYKVASASSTPVQFGFASTRKQATTRSAFAVPLRTTARTAPAAESTTAKGTGTGFAALSVPIPRLTATTGPGDTSVERSGAPRFATSIAALAQKAVEAGRSKEVPKKEVATGAKAIAISPDDVLLPKLATGLPAMIPLPAGDENSRRTALVALPTSLLPGSPAASLALTTPATRVGMVPSRQLQGVDLRLDTFDLSRANRVSSTGTWECGPKSLDECVSIGSAFWPCVDEDEVIFEEDDRKLLQAIFHRSLSDRRAEGEVFVPPDTSEAYMSRLHRLVQAEDVVRQQRRAKFLSAHFAVKDPGPIFPSSWKSSLGLKHGTPLDRISLDAADSSLAPCEHCAAKARECLKFLTPLFDKVAEDGERFRIYRVGCVQVRTTQLEGFQEKIEVVYKFQDPSCQKEAVEKSYTSETSSLSEAKLHPSVQRAPLWWMPLT